jgi:hypothetical protein
MASIMDSEAKPQKWQTTRIGPSRRLRLNGLWFMGNSKVFSVDDQAVDKNGPIQVATFDYFI